MNKPASPFAALLPLLAFSFVVTIQLSSAAEFDIRDEAAFKKIVTADAKVTRVAGDMKFTEGPVWIDKDGGYLVFSDIPANELKKWSPTSGATTFRSPSLNANGNTVGIATNAVSFAVSGVSGTFSPASPVTASAGIASSSLTPTTTGSATITASAAGLTSATATLTATAGAPAKLALVPVTTTSQVGTAVSYAATVQDRPDYTAASPSRVVGRSASGALGRAGGSRHGLLRAAGRSLLLLERLREGQQLGVGLV